MKKILFIVGLLLCGAAQANSIKDWLDLHGISVEASVGNTQYTKPNNTIWYQNEFHNTFDLQSSSYSIGITGYLLPSTRWRVAYTRLGQVSSVARATSDAIYNATNHCTTGSCPLNTYRTEGSVRGYSFTLAPEMQMGSFKVFAEAGAFVFLPKFIATIDNCSAASCIQQFSEGWRAGPQIGFGAEYRPTKTQLVVTAYRVDAQTSNVDAITNWQGWAMNAAVRQQF